jgi:hypothetical protein
MGGSARPATIVPRRCHQPRQPPASRRPCRGLRSRRSPPFSSTPVPTSLIRLPRRPRPHRYRDGHVRHPRSSATAGRPSSGRFSIRWEQSSLMGFVFGSHPRLPQSRDRLGDDPRLRRCDAAFALPSSGSATDWTTSRRDSRLGHRCRGRHDTMTSTGREVAATDPTQLRLPRFRYTM